MDIDHIHVCSGSFLSPFPYHISTWLIDCRSNLPSKLPKPPRKSVRTGSSQLPASKSASKITSKNILQLPALLGTDFLLLFSSVNSYIVSHPIVHACQVLKEPLLVAAPLQSKVPRNGGSNKASPTKNWIYV